MPFLSLVYQFVIGGAIFFLGIILSWRTKDYSYQKKDDRKILFFMIAGFALYFISQLLWYLAGVGKI
jgi:drug/metabolite transporter (DMT)-like permease